MNEKDLEKSLNEFHNTDLSFTKEDRKKVFQKIEEEQMSKPTSFFRIFRQRTVPLMAMAVLLTLSIVLGYSLIGTETARNADQSEKLTAMEQGQFSSLLLSLINEDNMTDLNLLITYDNQKGSINMTSLPSELAVPFTSQGEELESRERLTHIFAYGNGGKSLKDAVSKALDLPIDYYAAVKSDEFEAMLNTIGETLYNLDENKILLSLDSEQIKLRKGTNYLDGHEAVALMSARSTSNEPSNDWNERDRLGLAEEVLKNTLTHLPPKSANAILQSTETNGDLSKIISDLASTKLNSLKTVLIAEKLDPVSIDSNYYLQFKEGAEEKIKDELISFD
ncbi:LytR family transcriptional regulator [Bacillus salacetis]|uniref:LytR family transcriptional regulator n=1 Tax=Bacillus salacetis TaxID=2315464 RepID=A0A3A1R6X8_9BACI|nr:LCP family protein [Bacillus salacetis]RIW37271.1 LytR family transcriptional regulator [Bacillus salacetis]